jgi:exonuclease III
VRIRQGGVAIMWKRGMEMSIKQVVSVENYIQVVQISSIAKNKLYLINVYLPAANHGYVAFDESIAQLYDIYHYYAQDGIVVICGDFNSRVKSGSRSLIGRTPDDRRSNHLQMLLSNNNQYSLVASEMCQGPAETYLPYDGSPGTQIDHVIVHSDHASMVRNVNVHDDHSTNTSDHLPITVVLAVSVPSHDIQTRQLYRWDKADKQCYTYAMEHLLVDNGLINMTINNENDVDVLSTCLMDCMRTVSDNIIPKSQYCSYKKPYWNNNLRNMHVEQKRLRRIWICEGRPRGNDHPSYVEYKTAKYLFAKSLKNYASAYEQNQFRDISLTKDLNIRQFWK